MIEDETFHLQIEQAVAAAEKTTSAEIVVALARCSGSYRDIDLLAGAITAGLALFIILFAPFDVSPFLVVPYSAVFFVLGVLLANRIGGLRRLLTTGARLHDQVKEGAIVAFFDEGVSATRERNGIIIYVSVFESAVEILPDLGIDGKVPHAEWNRLRHQISGAPASEKPGAILAAIRACGEILAGPFPPGEENPNEIPDRPRIRA